MKLPTFNASIAGLVLAVGGGFVNAGPLVLNDSEPFAVPTLDTRIRYEYADLDGLRSSHNWSIRNRLGILTRDINGFRAFAEYEGTNVADKYTYRAAGVHGPADRTIIADPISHELNQLWVSYGNSCETFSVKVGRQAFNIDNQRWVGTVAWRQNMQTFDAATLEWTPTDDLQVNYYYISRVNRIFGSNATDAGVPGRFSDFEGNTHLVNAKFKSFPLGTLTAYAYSMDLETERGGLSANSNNSLGFHLTGNICDTAATYYLEYAHQNEAYDSPLDYEVNYSHGYVTVPLAEKLKATVGLEYLGADNGVGFKFPLGTNHKFNGFADHFLNTPAQGLTDAYAGLSAKLPCDFGASVFYHHFQDDGFDMEFGNEIDVVLTKKLTDRASLLAKGAFFMEPNSTAPFQDLTRVSFEMNYKF